MALKIKKPIKYSAVTAFAVVFAVGGFFGLLYLKSSAHAAEPSYTCQSDNTFLASTNSNAQLTTSDLTNIAKATGWLNSMMQTSTNVVTNSTITPSQTYASSYTGPITGTFNLVGRSYTTSNDASIRVDTPSSIPDAYNGVVTGQVLETPSSGRWIIQAYKNNNGTEYQEPVQALADGTTGDFSIDLSGVSSSDPGSWEFGLLDANNIYTPYGNKWPQPETYNGLEVQQKLVTDSIYDWSTTVANADGTFSFPNSNTGVKLFRLVDTTTHDILAESVPLTGLVRSYEYSQSDPEYGTAAQNQSYLYDQSVALFAAIANNEPTEAKQLLNGLLTLQTTTGIHAGGFVFSASQLSPRYAVAEYRTGADAIAIDAVLAYLRAYPTDTDAATYQQAAESGLTFLQSTLSSTGTTSGLYLGGYGDYVGSPATFDDSVAITWASTEHNVDAWQTLSDAAVVLGNTNVDYQGQANSLKTTIMAKLYNVPEQRFNQGMDTTGADTADPLDVNTWGAIELYATGNVDQANAALNRLSLFSVTKNSTAGYMPFYQSAGYPNAVPSLWFEGSFGAALAEYRIGNYPAYRSLIDSLTTAQQTDGSFVYATDAEPDYSIVTAKSVASTAWFVLATIGRNTIWNSCNYSSTLASAGNPAQVTTPTQTPSSPAKAIPTSSPATTAQDGTTPTDTTSSSTPAAGSSTSNGSNNAPSSTNPSTSANHTSQTIWIVVGSVVGSVVVIWVIIRLIRARIA